MTFRVEPHEATSNPLWMRLEKHLRERLAELRARNDADNDPVQTARLRGRIAELKDLLAAAEDRYPVMQPPPFEDF